mmetsp:Transcript_12211/g.26133  ORF Transcript_12211/g.26133 Transcript_12211/m.26133 type:complete len:828 (+) Transcript_12211:664-3147(+)
MRDQYLSEILKDESEFDASENLGRRVEKKTFCFGDFLSKKEGVRTLGNNKVVGEAGEFRRSRGARTSNQANKADRRGNVTRFQFLLVHGYVGDQEKSYHCVNPIVEYLERELLFASGDDKTKDRFTIDVSNIKFIHQSSPTVSPVDTGKKTLFVSLCLGPTEGGKIQLHDGSQLTFSYATLVFKDAAVSQFILHLCNKYKAIMDLEIEKTGAGFPEPLEKVLKAEKGWFQYENVNEVKNVKESGPTPSKTVVQQPSRRKVERFGLPERSTRVSSRVRSRAGRNSFGFKKAEMDHIAFTYPPEATKNEITVRKSDMVRAEPGVYLNDILIDFYVRYLLHQEKKFELVRAKLETDVYPFSSLFLKRMLDAHRRYRNNSTKIFEEVERWGRRVKIFNKKILVIPINDSLHWSLAIVCNVDQLPAKLLNGEYLPKKEPLERIAYDVDLDAPPRRKHRKLNPTSSPSANTDIKTGAQEEDMNVSDANEQKRQHVETDLKAKELHSDDKKAKTPSSRRTYSDDDVVLGEEKKNEDKAISKANETERIIVDAKEPDSVGNSSESSSGADLHGTMAQKTNEQDTCDSALKSSTTSASHSNTSKGSVEAAVKTPVESVAAPPQEESGIDQVAKVKTDEKTGAHPKDHIKTNENVPMGLSDKEKAKLRAEFAPRDLSREPCILLLDSLNCHNSSKMSKMVKLYLRKTLEAKINSSVCVSEEEYTNMVSREHFPVLQPKCPTQKNSHDCGLYVLRFIEEFLDGYTYGTIKLDNVNESSRKVIQSDWFTQELIDRYRTNISVILRTCYDNHQKKNGSTICEGATLEVSSSDEIEIVTKK